jgi:hypothetical protein
MTTMAMACLTSGDVAQALDLYEKLLAEFPDDTVARLMRDHATRQASSKS